MEDRRGEETEAALRRHGGHRESVARELNISRTTLWRRLKRYGLE